MTRRCPASLTIRFLSLFVSLLVPFAFAVAQSSSATLSGTVADESGAVIPGAQITVTNLATMVERQIVTNDSGSFIVNLLPPATYTLTVERKDFATLKIPGVVLNVGDQKSLQIELRAGNISETIQVAADAPLVDTSPAVGTVINRTFVENIPLNGRSFQTLFELTPGVVIAPTNVSGVGDGQFSVNGQRPNQNVFLVDGVSANTGIASSSTGWVGKEGSGQLPGLTASGTTASLVSVDALQEFRIETSSYAPEFGRQPGGQVSLVTRSGGNDFHGTAFNYIRNEAFDANNWFNNRNRIKRPPMRQHLFGGTFSGPIYFPNFGEGGKGWYSGKNRTFFFFSYEALRLRQPKSLEINVPTLCLRGEAICPTGQVAALPQYQPYLRAFAKPNGPEVLVTCVPGPSDPLCSPQTRTKASGFARFAASYADPSQYDAMAIRIDHNFGKATLFGRLSYTPSSASIRSPSGTNTTNSDQNNTSLTIGSTWTISNKIVNDLRFNKTVNDGPVHFDVDGFGGGVALQTFGFFGRDPGNSVFGFSISDVPGASLALQWGALTTYKQRQINIVDNLLVTAGDHQLKFGADFRRSNPLLQAGVIAGSENVFFRVANLTGGSSLSGRATGPSITSRDGQPHAVAFDNLSLYAQDTWKVNKRFTVTYGVRWEFVPPPHATEGSEAAVFNGLDNPLATNHVSVAPSGTPLWEKRYFNFAPRFGASYLLVQKPGRELVVRGGAGIFYDLGLGSIADSYARWPFLANISYPLGGHPDPACAGTTVSFPLPACALVSPVPSGNSVPGSLSAMDPRIALPRTYQWNFSAEQSLGANQTLTVSYVGAAGRQLLKTDSYLAIRLAGFTYPGTTATRLTVQRNGGYSNYHALQLQFQRRLSRGFQSLVSYTLGQSRDTSSTDGSSASFIIPNELAQPDREYGYSDFDVRHNLTAAATYQVPTVKNNAFLKVITRDWGLDLMFRARTAFPVNAFVSQFFPALNDSVRVRGNVVRGQPFWVDDPTAPGGRRLNRMAFSVPTSGTQGDLPRNSIRVFGAKQVDLALHRWFPLSEKIRLQLRAEAFNLFNWPNFAGSGSFGLFSATTTASSFGAATQMLNTNLGGLNALYQIGGPRSMQFAARISF